MMSSSYFLEESVSGFSLTCVKTGPLLLELSEEINYLLLLNHRLKLAFSCEPEQLQ